MEQILQAIKDASIKIKETIEQGDTGKSEQQNSTGDTQLKLDIASDIIIENEFKKVQNIQKIVSEERDNIIDINSDGKYLIAYDPLDGSSLVDVNLSVGSIYGIYTNDFTGENIVASVYVVFGPRVEMVYCDGNEVKLYRLDNNKNFNFISNITMNTKGDINSPGSTQQCWYDHHKNMIEKFFKEGYTLTYSGGMVPDLHHILLRGGGLFSYPGASDKPQGKLRQLFEVFPFAHIFETAGAQAIDGHKRVLTIETKHIHDTSACFFGSSYEIQKVKEAYKDR